MQTIRTKWHKIMPLIDAGEVYLTSPENGKCSPWETCDTDLEQLRGLVKLLEPIPKFVIERELLNIACDDEYYKSMLDMRRAGVLRLPFPAAVVEWTAANYHALTLVRDLATADADLPWEHDVKEMLRISSGLPFYGIHLRIHRDEEGDYLVVSPSVISVGLQSVDEARTMAVNDPPNSVIVFPRKAKQYEEPMVGFTACLNGIITPSAWADRLVSETYVKDAGSVFYAVSALVLLMSTQGVEREVIDTDRINRKRTGSKPPEAVIM